MKPKPLASLNHFTLPVVRMFGTSSFNCVGVPCLRYLSDYCLFAAEMAAFFRSEPLASLNHFTLPVVRMFGTSSFNCVGVPCLRYLSDYCLFAAEMAAFF